MTGTNACPKCGQAMVQGYVPDSGMYGAWRLPSWEEGEPKGSMPGGLKKPERERFMPIAAMRCSGCGFLELYARAEFRPS